MVQQISPGVKFGDYTEFFTHSVNQGPSAMVMMIMLFYNVTSIFTWVMPEKLKEFCRSLADFSYSFWVSCSELRSPLVFFETLQCHYFESAWLAFLPCLLTWRMAAYIWISQCVRLIVRFIL